MEKVSVAKGGILVEHKIFRWEIQNFNILVKNENLLKKQNMTFEVKDLNGYRSQWKLWFQNCASTTKRSDLKKDKREKELQLWFALEEKRTYCAEMDAVVDVTAEDAVGREIFGLFSKKCNYKTKTTTRQRRWTITKDLLDRDNLEELINGTLILRINLKVFTKVNTVIKEVEMAAAADDVDIKIGDKRKEQFYRKIAKLENDKNNSDVKLISSDGQEFYAYRWVLAEVSDVFDAMFRSDMKESETGVVNLDDVSGTTLKLLLHFIYTGKVGPQLSIPGNVAELAYAADKYQIEDLKNYLDSNIGKICTVENAGDFLILAKKISMEQATADIVLFIREKCKNAEDIIDIINNSNNR